MRILPGSAETWRQFMNKTALTDGLKTKKRYQFLPNRDIRWGQRLIANETSQFRYNNSFWLSSVSAADTSYLRFHSRILNPRVCGFFVNWAGIPLQRRGRQYAVFRFQQRLEAFCSETNHVLTLLAGKWFHILVNVSRGPLRDKDKSQNPKSRKYKVKVESGRLVNKPWQIKTQ